MKKWLSISAAAAFMILGLAYSPAGAFNAEVLRL